MLSHLRHDELHMMRLSKSSEIPKYNRVKYGVQPLLRSTLSVDTSKARSNIDVVRLCLQDLGWREFPLGNRGGNCDIYWLSVNYPDLIASLEIPQGKVNKLPGSSVAVRKASLSRSLSLMKQLFPEEYNFYPRTWTLPSQMELFCAEAKESKNSFYIVKPSEGSQGTGIYIIKDPSEYVASEREYIAQEYISNPLLLDDLKFDLRVYVVVTEATPQLEVYIAREGLARFCTVKYEKPRRDNVKETFMHLTNYSLNKKSENYVHDSTGSDTSSRNGPSGPSGPSEPSGPSDSRSNNDEDEYKDDDDFREFGSKRKMTSVFHSLSKKGYDMDLCWHKIECLIIKTLFAMLPELKVEHQAEIPKDKQGGLSCFQIFGFDVLLTEDVEPILLEVNSNPSLRIDYEHETPAGIVEYLPSPIDEEVKRQLILDTLKIIAPKRKLRRIVAYQRKLMKMDEASKSMETLSDKAAAQAQRDNDSKHQDKEATRRVLTVNILTSEVKSLHNIYPTYENKFPPNVRIIERFADLFIKSLVVSGSRRLSHAGFRKFTRNCRLAEFNSPTLDIMYVELAKKCNSAPPGPSKPYERPHATLPLGLTFHGFLDACMLIAKRRFDKESLLENMVKMVNHCESNWKKNSEKPHTLYFPKSESEPESAKSIYLRLPASLKQDDRPENLRNIFPRWPITLKQDDRPENTKNIYPRILIYRKQDDEPETLKNTNPKPPATLKQEDRIENLKNIYPRWPITLKQDDKPENTKSSNSNPLVSSKQEDRSENTKSTNSRPLASIKQEDRSENTKSTNSKPLASSKQDDAPENSKHTHPKPPPSFGDDDESDSSKNIYIKAPASLRQEHRYDRLKRIYLKPEASLKEVERLESLKSIYLQAPPGLKHRKSIFPIF